MSRRITTLAGALVLAMIATMLVVVYVGRADARALAGVEAVEVVVASGVVPKGMTLAQAKAQGLVTTEQLPRRTVPADAVSALTPQDDALVLASDMTAGEILRRPRMVQAEAVRTDGLNIPEGKLAIGVQLADPARVGGFVKVGSDVAIFDSYNVFEGNEGRSWTPSGDHLQDEFPKNKATRVLLPRVTVLAVGSTTADAPPARDDESDSADASSTQAAEVMTLLTVAVTQREAEKLVHGIQTGTLYLGLLSDSVQVQPGPGVDNRTLFD